LISSREEKDRERERERERDGHNAAAAATHVKKKGEREHAHISWITQYATAITWTKEKGRISHTIVLTEAFIHSKTKTSQ
jgi:hypothetical protein